MDDLIQSLTRYIPTDETHQLCLILSDCIKFIKNKTTDLQQRQSLYEECVNLYSQNNRSPFVIHLLNKLLVQIISNDDFENRTLNLSRLCDDGTHSNASFHQYLLKFVISKIKSDGYIPLERDAFYTYLCRRISYLLEQLHQQPLDAIPDAMKENHILIIKLHRSLLNHLLGMNKLSERLESYYTNTLKWIISSVPPPNVYDWRYISHILKHVTFIETQQKPEDRSRFSINFLESFFGRITHLVLCGTDLCGNIILHHTQNYDLDEYVVDEQTGRGLVLSLMGFIYLAFKIDNDKDISWSIKKSLSLIKRPLNDSNTEMEKEVGNDNAAVWLLENIFMDQDDDIIQFLALLFDIYAVNDDQHQLEAINPHLLFYSMCRSLCFDESVLLDWLMNENSSILFTNYMSKYVDLAAKDFAMFVKTLGSLTSNCTGATTEKLDLLCLDPNRMDTEANALPSDESWRYQGEDYYTVEYTSTMCCKGSVAKSQLVDYSSSSSSEIEGPCRQYTKPVEYLMSCLIRLHFKLDRLEMNGQLTDPLKVLCVKLERLEEIYEK